MFYCIWWCSIALDKNIYLKILPIVLCKVPQRGLSPHSVLSQAYWRVPPQPTTVSKNEKQNWSEGGVGMWCSFSKTLADPLERNWNISWVPTLFPLFVCCPLNHYTQLSALAWAALGQGFCFRCGWLLSLRQGLFHTVSTFYFFLATSNIFFKAFVQSSWLPSVKGLILTSYWSLLKFNCPSF